MSTSVPHLRDAPWWVRLAMAAFEKTGMLFGAGLLAAAILLGGMAAALPSLRGALLRWLLGFL